MTPVSEIIFSGFVSKAVNNCVDVSWSKIKEAVKNGKTKHQTLESQVYNITVDVLNKITNNQYANNQDRIYDAAELLLKSFKENERNELGNIKSCLQVFQVNVNENECMKFRLLLYEEISKNKYIELYHAILLLLLEQKNQYDYVIYDQLNQKLDKVILILNQKKDDDIGNNVNQKIKSRTQEYADKWNQNMFLNDFDKRDENAGVNIKLKEVYVDEHLPHYIWRNNQNISTDLKDLLKEYIYPHNDNKMLLILGQPGIGKSTLITWITANFSDIINDILVYRFASDLRDFDWQSDRLLNRILEKLGLDYKDLNRKTIILDGLDEVNINNRREVLDGLYDNLIYENRIKEFSLIITCRENYVQERERIRSKYIILQPWDVIQIRSFCNVFQESTKNNLSDSTIEKLFENREILGIPLILYMVLALNISIEKEGSLVDVYDRIFALDGGIYDKCINNKNFSEKHRIGELKELIQQVTRDIAIWVFENNPADEYIPKEEYYKICENVMQQNEQGSKEIQNDFMIGNFFRLVQYCDGIETNRLYFVHRTIYEYFVAETIFSSIKYAMLELTEKSQKEFAGIIAFYLKKGSISVTICEYLCYKIIMFYKKKISYEKRTKFYKWWESAINNMMEHGMFYYTEQSIELFDKVIFKEINCFINLLRLLRGIVCISNNLYIMEYVEQRYLHRYILYYIIENNIRNKIFDISALIEQFLEPIGRPSIVEINDRVDLSMIDLKKINFFGLDLKYVDLTKANLKGTIFNEEQVEYLEKKYNLQGSLVDVGKKIVDYEQYHKLLK